MVEAYLHDPKIRTSHTFVEDLNDARENPPTSLLIDGVNIFNHPILNQILDNESPVFQTESIEDFIKLSEIGIDRVNYLINSQERLSNAKINGKEDEWRKSRLLLELIIGAANYIERSNESNYYKNYTSELRNNSILAWSQMSSGLIITFKNTHNHIPNEEKDSMMNEALSIAAVKFDLRKKTGLSTLLKNSYLSITRNYFWRDNKNKFDVSFDSPLITRGQGGGEGLAPEEFLPADNTSPNIDILEILTSILGKEYAQQLIENPNLFNLLDSQIKELIKNSFIDFEIDIKPKTRPDIATLINEFDHEIRTAQESNREPYNNPRSYELDTNEQNWLRQKLNGLKVKKHDSSEVFEVVKKLLENKKINGSTKYHNYIPKLIKSFSDVLMNQVLALKTDPHEIIDELRIVPVHILFNIYSNYPFLESWIKKHRHLLSDE